MYKIYKYLTVNRGYISIALSIEFYNKLYDPEKEIYLQS